jgi:Ca-activated chloride channel family protein
MSGLSNEIGSILGLLHFIRPWWLLLLPLAIVLPLLWRFMRRPSGDWARVCDPHLLRWLSVSQEEGRSRGLGYWLAGLAVSITVLALAGPSWQKLPDSSFSARDARVIVLDLSSSMLAEDLRPNRLTRARFRLADLLEATVEGQTGLVSYAGDAYVVSPLTSDMNTIANLLPALQPNIIPVAGSRANLALEMAASLLERAGFSRGEILLVTDSADAADAARARALLDRGVSTSVMAVGTPDGAPIPSGAGFVNDRAGNVVIARMDRAALQAVAEAGGGKYVELGPTTLDNELWSDQEGDEFERRDEALGERWKDVGPWLVLLLLPLALAGFRRGRIFLVPLFCLPALMQPQTASAGWWDDLWQRRDQQAFEALQREDAETAAALAVDPGLAGDSWYRSGEYENATGAWSQQESADASYNRGNALALLGEYEQSILAYDEALDREPGMEDALANKALVEELLRQQQQQQEQESDSGESGEEGEPQEQQEGEQSQQSEGEEGEEGEEQEGEQQEGKNGEEERSEQEMAQAWTEEDAQAMEQWLRRIPDDPGGLLRRKFRNEHQRRGAPEDDTESW